jgi:hypothetical protein
MAISRKYCLSTPVKKMGFSQKASCKAQGFIKRSSKKYKNKYVISEKYKRSKKKSKRSKKKSKRSMKKIKKRSMKRSR